MLMEDPAPVHTYQGWTGVGGSESFRFSEGELLPWQRGDIPPLFLGKKPKILKAVPRFWELVAGTSPFTAFASCVYDFWHIQNLLFALYSFPADSCLLTCIFFLIF